MFFVLLYHKILVIVIIKIAVNFIYIAFLNRICYNRCEVMKMNIMHHDVGRDKLYKTWNTPSSAMIIFTYSNGGSIVFADKMLPIKRGALCFIAPSTRHYTMPGIPSE